MSFCLGKGSICLYSRSYVLQIAQPNRCGPYSDYQWRRIVQFIPSAKPPKFHPMDPAHTDPATSKGQWRLRLSSRWFETAYNLLYPQSHADPRGFRPFRIQPAALELLGAEAIGCLWADRGRLIRNTRYLRGQLNLARISWEEAELVRDWIARLTGAHAKLDGSTRNAEAAMLFYGEDAMRELLAALRPQWVSQAPCLAAKFQPPESQGREHTLRRQSLHQQVISSGGISRQAPSRRQAQRNRRVPRPLLPPSIKSLPSS